MANVSNVFKQEVFDKIAYLPDIYPSIDEVASIGVTPTILQKSIVTTAVGTSIEGQTITGSKIFIVGVFNFELDYVPKHSCTKKRVVYKFVQPFSTFLVIPDDYQGNLATELAIETIGQLKLNERTFYTSVLVLTSLIIN